MTTLFYRSWRLWVLAVFVIATLGASSLLTIGRQEDPTITNLFATIVTPYPGADPARVEALVTDPIEAKLREQAEIEEITSTSSNGISVIQVELSAFVPDARLEQVWSEIRDKLADVARELPAGTPEPEFDDQRTGAFSAVVALTAAPGRTAPMNVVQRYAETLQDRLRGLPGTELVEIYGVREEEILVSVDLDRLTSVGLTVTDVADALARADAKVRSGRMTGAGTDILVEVEGAFETLARIRAVPLRDGVRGRVLRLGDVAAVRRALADPPETLAFADGEPAILIAAKMETDLQVDAWMARVREALAAFEAELPGGVALTLLFDQSRYTADRLAEVATNLAIGVTLVVAVLLVTMGWRSAVIVGSALPLTALTTLAVLQYVGVPIHQMSVTGLIVALGLLVDAAIVMTDEIRRRASGAGGRQGAVDASVRRLAAPLLASTATTILAFLPMALLPGPAGDFVGSIAISVIVMLAVSFLIALTLTPALAGWMVRTDYRKGLRGFLDHGITIAPLGRLFAGSIDLALRRPLLSILAALVLPIIGFGAFPTLTAQFFPGVDRDQFYIEATAPGAPSVTGVARLAKAIGAVVAADPAVEHVHWVVGGDAPSFYYNMLTNRDGRTDFAEALVTTASPAATAEAVPRLQAALDRTFPQAQILVRDLVQGPPVNAPVELRLVGPELAELRRLGEAMRAVLALAPQITHTQADLSGGDPKLEFALDESALRALGLDLGAVAAQMAARLDGATGGSLVEATEELPVRVRVGVEDRAAPERVRDGDVLPPDAAALIAEGRYPGVPLAAVGSARLAPADSPIARRNGERVNTVRGYVAYGVLPEEALAYVQRLLAESAVALPSGYRLEVGGDADARAETVNNLISTLGLVVTLTIATVVLTFMRFRLALIALMVAGLSMGLSLLALAIGGFPFGVVALIGVIGSIGVSINAAIIIMTALQADPEAAAGDRTAMRAVVVRSSRHIVSTTVTTFGGFLPLILAGGGFWPPFAVAIAGGVLLSTVVSFYFTPPMFALVMPRSKGRAQAPKAAAAPPLAVAAE
jgi:multidrug efflux pump subunit AcrB